MKRPNFTGICAHCAVMFTGYAKPGKPRRYCSPACGRFAMKGRTQTVEHLAKRIKRGASHPNWKGDDATRSAGRTRAQRMYPARPCELCRSLKVDRHHRDENPLNNEASNVQFLCRPCHQEQHDFHEAGGRNRNRLSLEEKRTYRREWMRRRRVADKEIRSHSI